MLFFHSQVLYIYLKILSDNKGTSSHTHSTAKLNERFSAMQSKDKQIMKTLNHWILTSLSCHISET